MKTREKLQISTIAILSLVLLSYILVDFQEKTTSGNSLNPLNQDIINKAEASNSQALEPINEASLELHNNSFTKIYNSVSDSVVQIASTRENSNKSIIVNGNLLEQQSVATGSGFVYDKAGHIITNNHVVEGSTTIEVTFNGGNTYFAKSIGTDVSNDIAVLKITDDVPADEIIPLELDDSSDLVVGEPAIAIGNPFGLSNTMTVGIISQTGRLLPNQEGFSIPNVIQTDAAINPGNSGGPLLDLDGKVIGMNTAIQTNTGEFSGIGFAIPSNTIEKIVPILIEKGVYKHPWIGISGMNINSKISDALGLPKNYKGVLVANVIEDSPAEKAGIKEAVYNTKQEIRGGDIIIAIDKTPINRMADIIDYISTKEVGDTVQFTINRDGKTIDLSATLASRPDA
ncbi:MAG: trypsin-like peptidase domain-containing protein [Nitrosopumilaceae archaeon]|jgi:S1-C subfamily serine protease